MSPKYRKRKKFIPHGLGDVAKDFRGGSEAEGVFLTEKGRKSFLEAYESRLKETVQHPKLGRAVSYRRLIRLELYKIEKHLLGDETYVPYVSRW